MDYLNFGYNLAAKAVPARRLIYAEHEGRCLWIKQKGPPKILIWHILQKFIAACLPYPILRATAGKGGGLQEEAVRFREFKAKGWHVPEVLAVNDDMLVTSHLGLTLRAFLDKIRSREERLAVLVIAVRALASLHQSGLVHGRPYLRDMTWDGDRIGFLDLEENPVDVMPMNTAKARDIWIFLSSACRFARVDEDKFTYDKNIIDVLFNEYRRSAPPPVIEELRAFVRLLKPLRFIRRKFIWHRVGCDVRQSVFVTDYLVSTLK